MQLNAQLNQIDHYDVACYICWSSAQHSSFPAWKHFLCFRSMNEIWSDDATWWSMSHDITHCLQFWWVLLMCIGDTIYKTGFLLQWPMLSFLCVRVYCCSYSCVILKQRILEAWACVLQCCNIFHAVSDTIDSHYDNFIQYTERCKYILCGSPIFALFCIVTRRDAAPHSLLYVLSSWCMWFDLFQMGMKDFFNWLNMFCMRQQRTWLFKMKWK